VPVQYGGLLSEAAASSMARAMIVYASAQARSTSSVQASFAYCLTAASSAIPTAS
jgi:hypothetical protein